MAYNEILTPPPKIGNPPVLKFFKPPPPPILKLSTPSLQLEMTASAFFTHSYFEEAHVHISEATITD